MPELSPEIRTALLAPFDIAVIEIKPGATTKDKTRALALAYADSRAYQDRLDALGLVWMTEYRPLHQDALICRLTINGVWKEEVGEPNPRTDPNRTTIAAAQAFKRACAAFGLGRYLYSLEQIWAEYDEQKKCFRDPKRVIEQMYRTAGYIKSPAPNPTPQPKTAPPQQQTPPAPQPARAKMCPDCNSQMGQTRTGNHCRKCNKTYPLQAPSR